MGGASHSPRADPLFQASAVFFQFRELFSFGRSEDKTRSIANEQTWKTRFNMKKNIIDSHDPNQLIKTIPTASPPIGRSSTDIVTRAISLMGAFVLGVVTAQAADPTNTFYGTGALANVTHWQSLIQPLADNALFTQHNRRNTAAGAVALYSNTTAATTRPTGRCAALAHTTGINNTANGAFALDSNTTGSNNTANGVSALATRPGSTTRPTGSMRSIATPPGSTTRPTGSMRSLATRPATTTLLPALIPF